MKKFLLFLALNFSFSIYSFACTCTSQKIEAHYSNSDFVGEVKILKNYKNIEGKGYYKVDVLVENIYKGSIIKSIYVYGYNSVDMKSSCDILIPENTKLIIFAKFNKVGELQISMCSKLIYLDKNTTKNKRIIELLQVFKKKNINYKSIINKNFSTDFKDFLRKKTDLRLNTSFAIYEINLNKDLKVKCVKAIKRFKGSINKKIKRYLSMENWSVDKKFNNELIDTHHKHFLVVYYNFNPKTNKGSLSERIISYTQN